MPAPSPPLVETTGGRVRGAERDGIRAFKAIPYAAPPVGARRFAAPEPHPGWDGVRDGSHAGPIAPQDLGLIEQFMTGGLVAQHEDCLLLNVWTPACDGQRRPVMVWIHGGAFVTGAGSIPWYSGDAFTRDGVVLVTINYRLGLLGYGAFEGHPTAANNGTLDQQAALRWVQDNIERFGGDPGNVTIFGESAGGCAVLTLMATVEARGLFHRAIAQSPAISQLRSADHARTWARAAQVELGDSDPATVEVDALLRAQRNAHTALREFTDCAPTFGTAQLPEDPRVVIAEGRGVPVPLIIGTTRDEMKLFTVLYERHRAMTATEMVAEMADMITDPESLVDGYERLTGLSGTDLTTRIATDAAFRVPCQRLATGHRTAAPTAMYEFHFASRAFGGMLGACHAIDVPFVFEVLDRAAVEMFTGPGDDRAPLGSRIHRAWVDFAHGTLTLPHYDDGRATMIYDSTDRIEADPGGELRALWDQYGR